MGHWTTNCLREFVVASLDDSASQTTLARMLGKPCTFSLNRDYTRKQMIDKPLPGLDN